MYFPLFLMKSGRKRSAYSRRQFIQCFLTGAAFRQRPFVTDDEIVCGYQRIFRPDCAV